MPTAPRAAAIRDHLLPLVRSRGQRHQYGRAGAIGPLHLTTWESGALRFVLRAPFGPLRFGPEAEAGCGALPARGTGPGLPPFGLDVRRGRGVLLSVAWDREGAVEVVAFRPGARGGRGAGAGLTPGARPPRGRTTATSSAERARRTAEASGDTGRQGGPDAPLPRRASRLRR